MPNGGLISIAVLVPNILILIFPPISIPPPQNEAKPTTTRLMEIMERAGQIGAFVIPFFYRLDLQSIQNTITLMALLAFLGFYYAGWIRYLLQGRSYTLLFKPMLGIPLPMAISPVMYFLLASVLLNSWLLLLATILLGVGHIYVSRLEFQRCEQKKESAHSLR